MHTSIAGSVLKGVRVQDKQVPVYPAHDDLRKSIYKALHTPEMNTRLASMGGQPAATTPEKLATIVRGDTERWRPILKASGFNAE